METGYCPPRKASKILCYPCSSFAASRVLKNAHSIDAPVGGDPIQFIPFRKAKKKPKVGEHVLKRCVNTQSQKRPSGQQGECSPDPGPAGHCPWLCRLNACLGWSTARLGSKSRGGLVRWGEGGVGTLKQAHDVSGAGRPNKALGGDRDEKRFQALQVGKYFLRNYRNKVSFFISHLPKNSLPHTKCPAVLLYLPTWVACAAKGRGRRNEKGRVEDHFTSSREGQKHSWARDPAEEPQGNVVTALPVLIDLCRGQNQLEEREAEEDACCQLEVGWLGVGVAMPLQAASHGQPCWLRVPPGRQPGARRSPSGTNMRDGWSQLSYHSSPPPLPLQTSVTIDWKSHCVSFTN